MLREQEWNAKPEFEKRRVVVSVDLVGGKVVRKMAEVERPSDVDGEQESHSTFSPVGGNASTPNNDSTGTGAFAKNPLLGALIRPTWKPQVEEEGDKENTKPTRNSAWRRVQDDETDNEAWILDGGVYGGRGGDEERAHS